MRIGDILTLYDYNYWATHKILAASGRVSQEQFLAPGGQSFGSLRGTLVHALDAELGWRVLCQHQSTQSFEELQEDAFPTLAALEQRWGVEERAMRAYLAGLRDQDLDGYVRYTTAEGLRRERVLWHCLVHVVNHGTQHRSEAAALLTGYGSSPEDLDFTVFLNERRQA